MSTVITFQGRTRPRRKGPGPEGPAPLSPLSRRMVFYVVLFLFLAAI